MSKRDFQGKIVLITAGGTREPIDPVRFISNASSGKMGLALAEAVHSRGGTVIFITAAGDCSKKLPFKVITVETARQMFREVKLNFRKARIIIMAAAVADFRPEKFSSKKIKKGGRSEILLKLLRNPDILTWLGRRKGKRILVGFSAETGHLEKLTRKKLIDKNADLMVGVNLKQAGGVLGKDFTRVKLIEMAGSLISTPRLKKRKIADLILDRLSGRYAED